MALAFPRELPADIRSAPDRDAECRIFDALDGQLDGEFRFFYSVAWLARTAERGAREGEADFVIVHPSHGIIVLEVKGGYIRRDGPTGKWLTETRASHHVYEIKDPVAQARRSKFQLADKLQSLPRWVGGKPKIGHAVAFPHCEKGAGGLGADCPLEIVVDANDIPRISAAISRIFDYWSGTKEPCSPIDAAAMKAIESLLAPTVVLRPATKRRSTEIAEVEAEIAKLTSQQVRVLSALAKNRRVAVNGGAGTGKTMLALAKAKRLADEGFRTLLTCYNRPLSDHLAKEAADCALLEVLDFHQLCFATIEAAGLAVARTNGRKYWDEEIPNAFAEALSQLPSRRFDAIVVDEAQDFSDGWWVPLQLALQDPDDGILYLFYDDNQKLYHRSSGFPTVAVEYSLCENLRNTKPIHHAAARFYAGGELNPAGPNGPDVDYVFAADATAQRREIARVLHRLIHEERVNAVDIAILLGKPVDLSEVAKAGYFGSYRVTNDQERDPDRPLLESIARFKGLERPVVILADMEDSVTNTRDELIYVGLSRARATLTVIGTAEVINHVRPHSSLVKNDAPGNDYLRALKGET